MENTFELSPHIDGNKVFIVNRSEIKGRLDPYYYQPRFDVIEKTLSSLNNLNIKQCSEKIFSGVTPLSKGRAYTNNDGIPFIRSGDYTEDNTINFSETNYITQETHEKLMRGSKLKKHDLLIAIVGATIGKIGVYNYDYEANINQAICGVRFKSDINPFFVQIYLLTSFGQLILDRLKRPVARANINLEEIGGIPIPIMPIEKQHQIISYYYKQIAIKLQKEAEAKVLLDGIDDYLLGELDIVNREIKANKYGMYNLKLESNTGQYFIVRSNELHKRYDPAYFLPIYSDIQNLIKTTKYPLSSIKDICDIIQSGKAPNVFPENGIHYLKVRNIKDCAINWNTDKISPDDVDDKFIIDINDVILVTMGAGSLGKATVFDDCLPCQFDPKLTRFKLKKHINPLYFLYYIRTQVFQKCLEREIRGSTGMTMLNPKDIGRIIIPIPPVEKQNEIAKHISDIRSKAKALQKEAQDILANAKKEVERMILGE